MDELVPSVYLGLGSNLGDPAAAIEEALARLEDHGFHTTRLSSLWHTEPVGGPPQGWFLNAAAGGETALGPEQLLQACLETERAMGRVRVEKDGPRLIDVDILLFGDERREGPGLVLPHPRLHERRFVLEPLFEIAAMARHPVLGVTVAELRERCPDTSEVRRWRGRAEATA
jgi:2-amino-4-hydroxy-6-hydroxymethyldihydropteridine diphosphokinase